MDDFSPNENPFQESDKDHILSDDLGVAPAKRSKLGIVALFFVAFLLVGGIVYMSFLIVSKNTNWNADNVVTHVPEDDDTPVISLTDFDEENKLKNPVDPFKGVDKDINTVIQEKADFGDAPEETSVIGQVDYELFGSFPTVLDESIAGSIRHLEADQDFFLGMRKYGDTVTLESDAEVVNFDEGDDGIIFPLLTPCNKHSLQVEISVPKSLDPPYYLNALADWDHSSEWSGSSICTVDNEPFTVPEWFIQNVELNDFYEVLPGDSRRLIIPDFLVGPEAGKTWFRFTLTNEPIVIHKEGGDWDGSGYFLRGETEDYLVPIFSNEESLNEESMDENTPEEVTDESVNDDVIDTLLPDYKDILAEPIFTDVPPDAWYAPFVRFVSKEGVMKGFEDNSFKPSQTVTRAELVTIALRLRGADIRGEAADTDDDGLLDLEEMVLQTDPKNSDTDSDNLNDYRELMNFTDPLKPQEKLEEVPLAFDTIWSHHWARGNVVKALLMGLISSKSFVNNRFMPDIPATQEFALIVLLRASNKTLPAQDYLESAEKLGLIQSKESFDAQAPANRAAVAKFVAKLWNE